MLAGFGAVPLQPPAGTSRGSWGIFRVTPKEQAAQMMVRATVLDDGALRAAVVSLDVVLLEAELARIARERAGAAAGIAPENIVLQASHTHQGVYPTTSETPVGRAMVEAITDAVRQASQSAAPVTVRWARQETSGLNTNRRRRDADVDRALTLVRFDGSEGPRAVWYHFSAHALCGMGYDDRWSADFPGYVAPALAARRPGLHVQYLQGSAGDAAPFDWWFGNTTPAEPTHDATAQRLGRLLADECDALWDLTRPSAGNGLALRRQVIEVPVRKFWFGLDEIERLIAELEPRIAANPPRPWGDRLHVATCAQSEPEVYMLTGARWVRSIWPEQGKKIPCELQVFRVGDVALATNPGEMFTALARGIQAASRVPCTLVASYCNASIAYIPTRRDLEELEGLPFRAWIDQQKYRWAYGATITTRVGNEAGEMIVEATADLLRDVE